MTDRQTLIDLFERHADWHNDLAWIEVGCAADLIVDLEDAPARSVEQESPTNEHSAHLRSGIAKTHCDRCDSLQRAFAEVRK